MYKREILNNNLVGICKYTDSLYKIPEHECSLVDPNITVLEHVVLSISLFRAFDYGGSGMMSHQVNKHFLNGAIRHQHAVFIQNILILPS